MSKRTYNKCNINIFNILELSIYQDKEKEEIKLEDLIKSYLFKTDAGYSTKCPKYNSI